MTELSKEEKARLAFEHKLQWKYRRRFMSASFAAYVLLGYYSTVNHPGESGIFREATAAFMAMIAMYFGGSSYEQVRKNGPIRPQYSDEQGEG